MSNFWITVSAWFALMTFKPVCSIELDFKYPRANWFWLKEDFFNGLNGNFFGDDK